MMQQPDRIALPGPEFSDGMQCESRSICSSDAGELFCRYWPGKKGSPVVVYLHGIEGHGQWFEPTASYLNGLGITVYAPDRRGAGRNEADRGHVGHYRQWIDDVVRLLKNVKEEHPAEPLFLVGNCWGAKPALAALSENDVRSLNLAGLVLISPAVKVRIDVGLVERLAIAFSWLTRSRRMFPLPITSDMFTDDPAYIDFVERDPLRLKEVTASFLVENLKLGKIALETAAGITLPVLLLQSGRDRIVDVPAVEEWFSGIPSQDKQMYVFSWSQHSLDFDQHRDEYARCLGEWLIAHAEGCHESRRD